MKVMNQKASEIESHLIKGRKRIPIDVKYDSKHSLLIRSLNVTPLVDGTEFSRLVIHINGEEFELGPCRLAVEPNIDGYEGRLFFVKDVYDLQNLFFNGKLVRLQDSFLNLPLILSHKDKIYQPFKDYTAGLTYDLNVYKSFFDKLDEEYSQETEDVQNLIQKAIINTEGRKFMHFLDERLDELEHIVNGYSKEEQARHGFYFRKQVWNIITCSPFMKRTNLKPRGYAGDSEMMRMIYLNDYEGESTFSKMMHKHPLEQPGAEAVRNRKKFISQKLSTIKNNYPKLPREKLKCLSVG